MDRSSSKNRAVVIGDGECAQPRDATTVDGQRASESRRRSVDAVVPSSRPSRFDALRAAQVRAVGTAFLRARPLIVAPVAAVNVALVLGSGAPVGQRVALVAAVGAALALFWAERWWLSRAVVREPWLATSLVLTVGVLAVACALSGGIASPMLSLVVAPVVVAGAAFGRTRPTVAISALAFGAVAVLAVLPEGARFPAIAEPWSRAMRVCSFAGLLALAYAGVAGLVGAYVRAGELLERMRVATLEEAASRMRATEQVGARLAHELKNPLAAIKALLQILTDRVDERGARRLEVALAEVDRMDGIVRDYLAFARPLAELELADVDLRGLADDVVEVLADRARVAGVELTARGPNVVVRGDARRLREVVFNLVDNAIAATPTRGRVAVEVAVQVGGGGTVRIEDTGAGMPPGMAAAEPFTTTRADGTGLGLPIARGAVAQHGGDLVFTPRPGGGTIAVVTLPEQP